MVRFGFRSEGGKKMKIEEIRKGMKNREKNRLVQRKIEDNGVSTQWIIFMIPKFIIALLLSCYNNY